MNLFAENPLVAITAADWIATSMLIIMTLALAMVGYLFYRMNQCAKKPMSPEEELLQEMEDEEGENEATPAGGEGKDQLEPWEKDGDWWKNKG